MRFPFIFVAVGLMLLFTSAARVVQYDDEGNTVGGLIMFVFGSLAAAGVFRLAWIALRMEQDDDGGKP